MQTLVDLIWTPVEDWDSKARPAFQQALAPRYPRIQDSTPERSEEKRFQLRLNADVKDKARSAPFVALIAPDQERSGPYGGMSFVMFPPTEGAGPALIGMVVGTNGLSPDDGILGRPGHARKVRAICRWLNRRMAAACKGEEETRAWARHDPTRIDQDLPKAVKHSLEAWPGARDKYGRFLYATFRPPQTPTDEARALVRDALAAFIDLFFDERGIAPLKDASQEVERIRRGWLSTLLPDLSDGGVVRLLKERRYAVIEGPPGTGKTEMALRIKADHYKGRGKVVQFHPGTTHEDFIGGLSPVRSDGAMGFTFAPKPGILMEAAREAGNEPYLLIIDEINRADLAKVLGEAIYLFEPGVQRSLDLPYDFPYVGRHFSLPANLHVLGTMNSADRSIAILDVAVRRRFAFTPLWPQLAVVEGHGGPRMQRLFHDLLLLFVEHASDDAFVLMPGHAWFLAPDSQADSAIRTRIRPLLEEYLAQGYVAGFADEIRAFLDRLPDLSVQA